MPGATPLTSPSFHVVKNFNNASLSATAAIADNDIWAVGGSNSQPLAAHFDGKNWSAVPTPTINHVATFAGVAGVASNDVWAVGYESVGSSKDQPLIEHWDGTSWSVVSSPNLSQGGFLEAVTAISKSDVWAVGAFDNLSGGLVEHWDGSSWSVVSSPAFNVEFVTGISADASNDIWAETGTGPILHFDGTNWSQVHALNQPRYGFAAFKGITALSPTDVWAVGEAKFCNNCRPAGLTWNWDGTSFKGFANQSFGLQAVSAISASNIWAVGFDIENWNGTSWTSVSGVPSGVSGLDGVSTLSDGTVVVVSSSGAILMN
jgi:photosystem II stability/assembly factor-like uncharacterized protein